VSYAAWLIPVLWRVAPAARCPLALLGLGLVVLVLWVWACYVLCACVYAHASYLEKHTKRGYTRQRNVTWIWVAFSRLFLLLK